MKIIPKVYIVCGVHNNIAYTKKLMSCIAVQKYQNVKTIIIDDESDDGTVEYLSNNYPKTVILKGNGDLWWTGSLFWGVSEILKMAKKNDFILTLNNDCTFGNDYILKIVKTALRYDSAIVGSLVISELNKLEIIDAGVKIDWAKGRLIAQGPKLITQLTKNKTFQDKIDTLSTKGTLYPVDVFAKIGNFDKLHLPHYASDYEFACRAKRSGYKLLIDYTARIYNDPEHTGLGMKLPDKINVKELLNLLFNRKSRLNVVDKYWFIKLCCPLKYQITNYLILIFKTLGLLTHLFPLSVIHSKRKIR